MPTSKSPLKTAPRSGAPGSGAPASASGAPAGTAHYVSAYKRLEQLPDLFTLNILVRQTGTSRAVAKVQVSRWAERGLIEGAGPRSGIYFNRVRDRAGERATVVRALLLKYPSATLCGASVLHAAGWTTQIPSELHVAVEARRSYAKIKGVQLHARPVAWFRKMHAHGAWSGAAGDRVAQVGHIAREQSPDATTYGLRSLAPAWALADAFADRSGGSWRPDIDDLYLDEDSRPELARALAAMLVTDQALLELAEPALSDAIAGGQGEEAAEGEDPADPDRAMPLRPRGG